MKNAHFVIVTFQACVEAYKQQDEQYACNLGCENQLPFAEQRQKRVRKKMRENFTAFKNTV